jgi:phenylalanyl-tRNA synthetase beta chain
MKSTLEWLREFVDFELEPVALADRLTNVGLECTVEIEGALDGVVVGEILEVSQHPRADHLKVCRVRARSEVFTVVCGAPNTEAMTKVPFAQVGAQLPEGIEIEATEIRGVRSEGMLCSEAELGVGEDASGLWILPETLRVGVPLDEALHLSDWVFEFDLTPNRGDCLSILGLALEVAAIAGSKVRIPEIKMKEEGTPIDERFKVRIRDPDLCPRYVARIVEATSVRPSPLWMRRRLQLVGLRPINNLVDVTNYVMWELGQPLHAFDLDLLEGAQIVVQRARDGESFVSLDGEARSLTGEMLMIWDGVKPVAVAGVMGGENSEVLKESRNILIESAHFAPMNIRRTARRLGMATEASRRFERGIDPEGCVRAANRAAYLIANLAGGTVAPGCIDAHPIPVEHKPILLRPAKVNELLGTRLEAGEIKSLLRRLDFEVEGRAEGALRVLPPARRVDLMREVDLVEEVARVWGFDQIPESLPGTAMVSGSQSPERQTEQRVREILVGLGFHEIITYAFIDEAGFDRLELAHDDPLRAVVALRNPIRQDQRVMRTTLLYGLLETVKRNILHKNQNLRFFEVGRVFVPRMGERLPHEPCRLGGVMTGARHSEYWGERKTFEFGFYDLKGNVEKLLDNLQIPEVRFLEEALPPFLREGSGASIVSREHGIGWLGELASSVRHNWDLEANQFVFEIDFDFLTEVGTFERRFKPLPRYPEVARDLSIVVNQDIRMGDVLREIRQVEPKWFSDAYLLDVFTEGDKIPHGKKSLTFRIIYRSDVGSLRDDEVNEQQRKLIQQLEREFKAKLRS